MLLLWQEHEGDRHAPRGGELRGLDLHQTHHEGLAETARAVNHDVLQGAGRGGETAPNGVHHPARFLLATRGEHPDGLVAHPMGHESLHERGCRRVHHASRDRFHHSLARREAGRQVRLASASSLKWMKPSSTSMSRNPARPIRE
ncbi:MAG: hypothetical protein NOF05_15865 [Candidatus Accumulibacter phosphatis]|uniref:Uncharacterized protein n=1 Tax=Candidatus Accumulibacter cognatus TaxID=2954383 RepID=A0A7D5NFZ7_9PROT|nr:MULTISPECIES: hypothetical protein [Candidatus Accumulibacter]MCQ1550251.1 hypothetical protein [Candidatus Accumulibacter phosphatis]MBN8520209.1 hypothetical protein [Accumulibacter sp.]MBO3711459.1 hypothetical protein [Accumulibacter sp.]MCM8579852.1 hypothetical protein [Accumulibacter sp.]QLH51668.1 MAG: hypothetical protein HWD57_19105 [Candidatus Accumulibacter cognatus]